MLFYSSSQNHGSPSCPTKPFPAMVTMVWPLEFSNNRKEHPPMPSNTCSFHKMVERNNTCLLSPFGAISPPDKDPGEWFGGS